MNTNQAVPEVTPFEAFECLSRGACVLLDVRESDELQTASIPDAFHVPLGELSARLGEIPLDRDVYVLCHVGQRSAMATEFLLQLGHERVWNVRGGIIAWARDGLPVKWSQGTG